MPDTCARTVVRGHGFSYACASVRPCPTHDAPQVRLSDEDFAKMESERAFEQGLGSHDANALHAWQVRTGKEIQALPFPLPLEQEALFG